KYGGSADTGTEENGMQEQQVLVVEPFTSKRSISRGLQLLEEGYRLKGKGEAAV
ncbi:Hypothetical predicted protein, partial [Pelobates cultripes]